MLYLTLYSQHNQVLYRLKVRYNEQLGDVMDRTLELNGRWTICSKYGNLIPMHLQLQENTKLWLK